jgi:hypothetical protein
MNPKILILLMGMSFGWLFADTFIHKKVNAKTRIWLIMGVIAFLVYMNIK